MMQVEVCYATESEQYLVAIEVAADTTVAEAIQASDILTKFPEIDLSKNKVGIFSRPVPLDQPLRSGDRIEIYRPLTVDPKQARRERERQS